MQTGIVLQTVPDRVAEGSGRETSKGGRMNLYSQILKDRLTPEQYNKIPPFLRHRDEPDLFYHLIYNCYLESINGRKRTKEDIENACRIASGKKVPELLKSGDSIRVYGVYGTLDQPFFRDGRRRVIVVKEISGPYHKSMEFETPENYSIIGKDGSIINDLIAIDGVICGMWKSEIEFVEIVNEMEEE